MHLKDKIKQSVNVENIFFSDVFNLSDILVE